MRRLLAFFVVALVGVSSAFATPQKPTLTATVAPTPARPGEFATVTISAKLIGGTHIYGLAADESLFTPTSVTVEGKGITAAGQPTESKTEPFYSTADKATVGVHGHEATFTQAIQVDASATPGTLPLKVSVRYQACDDSGCLPPTTEEIKLEPLTVEAGAVRAEFASPGSLGLATPSGSATGGESAPTGLLAFILTAFGAGLLALITPCVFPMIPVTFAYFTKVATAKGSESPAAVNRTILQLASLYCIGIIVSFVIFGFITAVTVGAAGATSFAANPMVNVGFGLIFIGFGLALLEVVELKLPSKVQQLTGAGRKTGGYLGVFLLGLTFVIASFTCAAPFVGTVMVLAAKGGDAWRAVLGMGVFATALALPFFLLALFPSLLKKLPKSGDWLTTIKGVMGFLELAAAVKFFSNADLVWDWNLFTVPFCLALYTVVFFGCGLWLIGKLYVGFNTPQDKPTVPRRIWSGLFIAAALYSLYGTSGRPLHPLTSGFLPPADHTGFGSHKGVNELDWERDLEKAKTIARESGKRLVIDFTGHTCTNCRDVETRVFPEVAVKTELEKLVRVRLYTDGGKYASQAEGKANADLALKLFDNLVNPLYAVIDADGNLIAKADYNLAKDPVKMAEWLKNAGGVTTARR
ncbi:MAG: thioredoxin family protein [Armatimonadetes bacterium]|nr:thioredoxin family protein [Armatimonadota bacterium]